MNDDPYRPPASGPDFGSGPEPGAGAPGGWGPPPSPPPLPPEAMPSWERRESIGFLAAWFKTIGEVLFRPDNTFYWMKREGGIGGPLGFFALTLWTTQIIGFAFWIPSMFFVIARKQQLLEMIDRLDNPQLSAQINDALTHLSIPGHAFWALVGAPALYVAGLCLLAGMMHLMLMALGAAKGPFETTFRVAAYAGGACCVIGILPLCCCQSPILFIALIVVLSIGLTRAHATETWRGVVAAIVPFGVLILFTCCGAFVFGLIDGATRNLPQDY
jgi:hypothetical protein